MKALRKIIEIDEELCDGCGQCMPGCAEGALQIVDGKAKIVEDKYCDGLGACIGECPNDALKIVEREADEFDEEAVEQHLAVQASEKEEKLPCGCPSSQIMSLVPDSPCSDANKPVTVESPGKSSLSHWPIQIKLIPAKAPFLSGADLLVMADCVAVAFPTLHRDFLKGRAVMIGCPKLDDAQEYIDKFTDIFKIAGIKSVTSVVMEVPCCSGLPAIVKKGMETAQKNIPMKNIVISTRGEIIEQG